MEPRARGIVQQECLVNKCWGLTVPVSCKVSVMTSPMCLALIGCLKEKDRPAREDGDFPINPGL